MDRDEYPPAVGRGKGAHLVRGSQPARLAGRRRLRPQRREPLARLDDGHQAAPLLRRHPLPLRLLLGARAMAKAKSSDGARRRLPGPVRRPDRRSRSIVMAVISLAALVDPFDWMPRVHRIWADCSGDCALAHRFPGFWWHAAANLALRRGRGRGRVAPSSPRVADVRGKRVARYDSADDLAAFAAAHDRCIGAGALLGGAGRAPDPRRDRLSRWRPPRSIAATRPSAPSSRCARSSAAPGTADARGARAVRRSPVVGPFVAAPLTGGPGATVGAIVAAVLCAGCAVALWPWRWSDGGARAPHASRRSGRQARPDTDARDAVGSLRRLGAEPRRRASSSC